MKTKFSRLIYYSKLLSNKWILWVSIVIGLIAFALGLLFNAVSIPPVVYWIIGLIGIFWSSYQVFEEVSKKIPEIQNFVLDPEISINFIEGNEYSFDLLKPHNVFNRKNLPWSEIQLNLRIENSGNISIDILSIKNDCLGKYGKKIIGLEAFSFGSLQVTIATAINMDLGVVQFPVHLEPGQTFLCKLAIPIQPDPLMTAAQVASRLRILLSNLTNYLIFNVSVEVVDKSGKYFTFNSIHKVVGRPLWDTYIAKWTETGEVELVRLAGGTYLPETITTSEKSLNADQQ